MPTQARLKGFSLIELLVVVMIMSLLALLAMPNATNTHVRRQVKEAMEIFSGISTHNLALNIDPEKENKLVISLLDTFVLEYQMRALFLRDEFATNSGEGTGKINAVSYNDDDFIDFKNYFPENNEKAGWPKPESIFTKYMTQAEVVDGAIHIYFGNNAHPALQDTILTIQPMFHPDDIKYGGIQGLEWKCGYSKTLLGKIAAGENLTTVPGKFLPFECL